MCLKNVFFDINTISKQMGCALQIGSSHRITSLVKIQRLDNAWWCHFWQLGPWLLSCLPHSLLDISFVRCKKCKMNYYHLLPLFPKNKNMFQMEVSFICHPFLTVSKVQRIIHNFQRGNGCGHQHHRFLGGIDASRGGQQGVETSGTIDGEVPQADQTRVVRQTSPKCVKMCLLKLFNLFSNAHAVNCSKKWMRPLFVKVLVHEIM